MQGDARSQLSTSARTIIDIHERAGGTVSVRRQGRKLLWRIDGGEETCSREASERMSQIRKERMNALPA